MTDTQTSRYSLPRRAPFTKSKFQGWLALSAVVYPIIMLGMTSLLISKQGVAFYGALVISVITLLALIAINYQLQSKFFSGPACIAMTALYVLDPALLTAYMAMVHAALPPQSSIHSYFTGGVLYVTAACILMPIGATAIYFRTLALKPEGQPS